MRTLLTRTQSEGKLEQAGNRHAHFTRYHLI
jgi:hypothetical protein